MMLTAFKASKPAAFIQQGSYTATLEGQGDEVTVSIAMLDGTNEGLMDVLLCALMDLEAEGKTIADVRYRGKSTRRWFQLVYPSFLSPYFLGIFSATREMLGYLVAYQSPVMQTRKVIGIALIQSARGKHVGSRVIKHVQDHLASIFPTPVAELNFETSRSNTAMTRIAEQLGFIEYKLPDDATWKGTGLDRVRFTWRKES